MVRSLSFPCLNPAPIVIPEPEGQIETPEQPTLTPSHLDDEDDILVAIPYPPLPKYVAYVALVKAAEERAATLYASPVSALSESITMNLAKLDARRSGLLPEEIEAALQIGAWRGRQQRACSPNQKSKYPQKHNQR